MRLQLALETAKYIIGVDECGRGCLFGDVVAGACLLKAGLQENDLSELIDSKKIKRHEKRVAIAERIRTDLATVHGIGVANVAEIEEHNILGATMIAMHRALDALMCSDTLPQDLSITNTLLAVDGCYFKPGYKDFQHLCVVGGDDKVKAISAASILAKSHRDEWVLELVSNKPEQYKKYGLATNMGYGTAAHRAALIEHGASDLHRRSFIGRIVSE